MKVIDYTIEWSNCHIRLKEHVLRMVGWGWQPVGGVAIDHLQGFYQAMVKYECTHEAKDLTLDVPAIIHCNTCNKDLNG